MSCVKLVKFVDRQSTILTSPFQNSTPLNYMVSNFLFSRLGHTIWTCLKAVLTLTAYFSSVSSDKQETTFVAIQICPKAAAIDTLITLRHVQQESRAITGRTARCSCKFWCVGPILHRFRDNAGFVLMTPTLFNPNFGGVPVAPDHRVGANRSINLKYSNLYDHGTWTSRTDRRTDRRTDGQTTHCGITALCVASRDNKELNTPNASNYTGLIFRRSAAESYGWWSIYCDLLLSQQLLPVACRLRSERRAGLDTIYYSQGIL